MLLSAGIAGLSGLALARLAPLSGGVPGLLLPSAAPSPLMRNPLTANRPTVMAPADYAEWQEFRDRFIAADGRVVDDGNNGVSHSEGQGWGLLLAASFDDVAAFEQILQWTQGALRRPGDRLHAWRYRPGQANPVDDPNNATDGDLFIAGALARAARRWQRPELAAAAAAIARDILALCVRPVVPRRGDAPARLLLLPGAEGFTSAETTVVNLSYYSFALFPDLDAVLPSPLWAQLQQDGLALIAEARFGRWQLPPDWLAISHLDGGLAPADGWPARFSYDAIRVPLHLGWAGLVPAGRPDMLARYRATTGPELPAWVDLRVDSIAGDKALPGMADISKLTQFLAKKDVLFTLPSVKKSPNYYSAGLSMLSLLAWREVALI